MTYKFKYRRPGRLWKSHTVVGHNLDNDLDRMILYYENGSIRSIPKWSQNELFLDTDWVLATKAKMEDESGQDIKLRSAIGK
jgi:hypothetical protein